MLTSDFLRIIARSKMLLYCCCFFIVVHPFNGHKYHYKYIPVSLLHFQRNYYNSSDFKTRPTGSTPFSVCLHFRSLSFIDPLRSHLNNSCSFPTHTLLKYSRTMGLYFRLSYCKAMMTEMFYGGGGKSEAIHLPNDYNYHS